MAMNPRTSRTHARRAGILLEVMLSMAIFIAAAAFILAATGNVFRGLDHSMRQQQAMDLARSKMAELDAGLISIMDLRGQTIRAVGSIDELAGRDDDYINGPRWIAEITTQRTGHRDVTLIELTVREDRDADVAISFTLRQLVRLREQDPEAYEEDDLLEGLPDAETGEWR
jgi:hypothetical protein